MPLNNLAAGPIDSLGSVPGANVVGSFLQSGDKFRKKFITVNKNPVSSGNGITGYDDPTYLGFTLTFDITSPLFNGATKGAAGATAASGSENNTVESQSAIGYLKEIGENNRANYLQAFVQGIREINNTRPYYWQSITGLSEAWQATSSMGPDPYVGSKEGEGISIDCLEAIDLKLTALFSLYRLAVYDSRYRRFVLPKNLMYFDVDVQVAEIRNFKQTVNYLSLLSGGKAGEAENAAVIKNNSSFVKFRFTDCVWAAEESSKAFDTISNVGGEVVSTSIKWSYSNVMLDAEFAGYDQSILSTRQQKTDGPIDPTNPQDWTKFAKDQATQAAQQALQSAASAAERAVLTQVNSLIFGNVHGGVQNTITNVLQNPGGALVNATIGGIGAAIQQNGSQAVTAPIQLADNIMPAPAQTKSSLPTEKIQPAANQPTNFDGAQPKPFSPTNVFGPGPSGPPPLTSSNVHG
jgi:uncharacterized membrane protein YeaQ/YmgE (transglycosylase-associated protein family)